MAVLKLSPEVQLYHSKAHCSCQAKWSIAILVVITLLLSGCEPPQTRPPAKPVSKIHILVSESIKPQIQAIDLRRKAVGTLGLMYEANEIGTGDSQFPECL